jgi:hypothetical protein
MLLRIYFGLWALVAVVAAALFLTGNLTNLAVLIVGFMIMPLIFAGMIIVLPLSMTHSRSSHDHIEKKSSPKRIRRSLDKISGVWDVKDMSARQLEKHHQAS